MCRTFFRQIITVLLVAVLLITSVPVMAGASEEDSPQYLYAVGYLDADQFISRYGMKGSVVSQKGSFMGSGSVFNRENKDYTVIVRGDISGDGRITSADYLGLKRSFNGSDLSDIAALAGDINGDNRLTSTDYLSIKKYFDGTKELWDADTYVGERYMSYRIWNFSITSMSDIKSIVDAAKNVGFNAINLHIPWYHVEKEDGVYDYSAFDPMVDYIVNEKGMSCAIILYMGRIPSEDKVLSDEDYDRDPNGNLSYGTGNDRTGISFSSEKAVSKCVDFYEDAVKHFDSLYGRNIMLYLPCFSTYNETEYSVNGNFDYAHCAIEGFRAFLREKYGSIDNFNQKLGVNYASFDSVNPPYTPTTMDNMGILWYQYRHGKLKNIIDKLAAAQHTACPDTKFCVQFGSVHDSVSVRRGTYDFVDLCENADVIWVDDGPNSRWDWSMDYLWANLPRTVEIGNEIDGPAQAGATMERYLNQGLESYRHGAKYVVCANWGFDTNFHGWSEIWREISGTWLTEDRPELITPAKGDPTFEVSAYGLFRSGAGLYEGYYSSPANALAVNDLTNITPQNQDVYRFAVDFSGQGWSYGGWRSHGTGKKVPVSFISGRWFASDCWIGPGVISPGATVDADVIFTVPSDGAAILAFSYGLGNKAAIGSGVRILLNGEQIYPTEGEFARIPSAAPLKGRLPVTLKQGDELTFRLTRGSGDNGALVFASVNVEMN